VPVRRHALVSIEATILLGRPGILIAPFPEIGIGPLWQIFPPRRFERRARSLEVSRGAVPIVARIAAGIEAAAPLPLIRRWRSSRSLDDHPDANAGIVDVPGFGPIVDALAGEGGHVAIKARSEPLGKSPYGLGAGQIMATAGRGGDTQLQVSC
jgi:hypothetical protein